MTQRGKRRKLKLNIGCGTVRMRGYVGVDKFKTSAAQVVAPAHDLPYKPNTVDVIFTSHMIEHLVPSELDAVLKEWKRVLRPGGTLTVRCPNFELYVREYLDASEDERHENPWLLRNIFGWRNKPGQFHYDGWSVGRFHRVMPAYGFTVASCKTVRTRASRGVEYRPSGDIVCVCKA